MNTAKNWGEKNSGVKMLKMTFPLTCSETRERTAGLSFHHWKQAHGKDIGTEDSGNKDAFSCSLPAMAAMSTGKTDKPGNIVTYYPHAIGIMHILYFLILP